MRSALLIGVIILLFASAITASNPDDLILVRRSFQAYAIKVTTATGGYATGILSTFKLYPQYVLFISNKHVFRSSKVLTLAIPMVDSLSRIINICSTTINVLDSAGRELYFLADDTSMDIAAIPIILPDIPKGMDGVRKILPLSKFSEDSTLFIGQEVEFYGYPLNLKINQFNDPLFRKGAVAGIDTLNSLIYLDADAFGGSSGSPVFLDLGSQENLQSLLKYEYKAFVGIVSRYEPFIKQFKNVQTGNIEMIQTENSGIAVIMPASQIGKLAIKVAAQFPK